MPTHAKEVGAARPPASREAASRPRRAAARAAAGPYPGVESRWDGPGRVGPARPGNGPARPGRVGSVRGAARATRSLSLTVGGWAASPRAGRGCFSLTKIEYRSILGHLRVCACRWETVG